MRVPIKLLALATLGVALVGAAPAEAHKGRDRGHGGARHGYWYDPPPRWVPARPRHWHRPGPRVWHAPPSYHYVPPPRVYYPRPHAGFHFRF